MKSLILLILLFGTGFLVKSQGKLYSKHISKLQLIAFSPMSGVHGDTVYFANKEKIINSINNWHIDSLTNIKVDTIDYENIYRFIILENNIIIDEKYIDIKRKWVFFDDLMSTYNLKDYKHTYKVDIDFEDVVKSCKIKHEIIERNIDREVFTEKLNSKHYGIIGIEAYLNRTHHAWKYCGILLGRPFYYYEGEFAIFYDFNGSQFEGIKGETDWGGYAGMMKSIIDKKFPNEQYHIKAISRSAIKSKNNADYFTIGFLIYSNKDFYNKIHNSYEIDKHMDWEKYTYTLYMIKK
jgi:hypothetical protein